MQFILDFAFLVHRGVRRLFTAGVYTETWEDIADGGPTCYNELSPEYRIVTSIMNVNLIISFHLVGNLSLHLTALFITEDEEKI